jgi:hypothetical protein
MLRILNSKLPVDNGLAQITSHNSIQFNLIQFWFINNNNNNNLLPNNDGPC